jgi:hypothetical protein
MTVESFAHTWRLKIRLDGCGDKIIPGKRGHLYFDDGALCLMVTDGAPAIRSRWQALGGKLWMGEISPHPRTKRRVQDVKITGIPLENAKAAIGMMRAQQRRVLTDEQRARILAVGAATRFNSKGPSAKLASPGLESIAEGRVDPEAQPTTGNEK